jgi:hypothetical protein
MNRRLSVRLPEGLAWGIEALAERSGKSKSEIVRDALNRADVRVPSSAEIQLEALRRAAAVRAGQTEVVDAAALIREVRDEMEGHDQSGPPTLHDVNSCTGRPSGPARATGRFQQSH